jgi:hypothetical protein
MKTLKILLVFFLVALLYAGCRKEKEIVKSNQSTVGSHFNGQRIEDRDMEAAMNHFITLTLNNRIAQCDDYEAQDALLIMEAALNYHTCMPDSDYYEIVADTFTIELTFVKPPESPEPGPDTGPQEFTLSHDTMATLWPIILDSVESANERVTFDSPNNPFNVVVDLEFIHFNPDSDVSAQTVTLQVVTWVANSVSPGITCSYGTNDYWYAFPDYALSNGGCGSNSSNTSSNCLKQMNKRLGPLCRGICDASYYSNIFGGDWGADPGPSSCASMSIYWSTSPNDCFSPTDIACYTQGAKEAIAYFANYYSGPGNCIIVMHMHDWYTNIYYQYITASWGIPHTYNPD